MDPPILAGWAELVLINKKNKKTWNHVDFELQMDVPILTRRPDPVLINEKKLVIK